jgi:hypothetical protein
MSTTPPPPIVPPAGDDDDTLLGEGERPLDPDLNEDLQSSADADRRAATEGELDGSEEE